MKKKRVRTMCLWCGKDHRGQSPKECKEKSLTMSAVCKKIEVWKAMRVLEVYGYDGLYAVAVDLGLRSPR